MMNLLGSGILETLSKWNVIVGLVVVVLALALMLASSPIVKRILSEKSDEEKNNTILALKVIAAVLAIIGCILVMFIQ